MDAKDHLFCKIVDEFLEEENIIHLEGLTCSPDLNIRVPWSVNDFNTLSTDWVHFGDPHSLDSRTNAMSKVEKKTLSVIKIRGII